MCIDLVDGGSTVLVILSIVSTKLRICIRIDVGTGTGIGVDITPLSSFQKFELMGHVFIHYFDD